MTLGSWLKAFGKSSMGRRVNTDQISFILTRVSHLVNQSIVCATNSNVGVFMLKNNSSKNQSKVSCNVFLRRKWHHSLGDNFHTFPFMAEGICFGCWDIHVVTLNILWWLMITWLLSCTCLGPGWGGHDARPSWSDWQPCLDRGLKFTPCLWFLRIAGIAPSHPFYLPSSLLFIFLPSLLLQFSSVSAPSHTLCARMFSSPFALKNSLHYQRVFGQAQPPSKNLFGSLWCRWLERVKIHCSSCLSVRSESWFF